MYIMCFNISDVTNCSKYVTVGLSLKYIIVSVTFVLTDFGNGQARNSGTHYTYDYDLIILYRNVYIFVWSYRIFIWG